MTSNSPIKRRVRLIPTVVVTAVVIWAPEGFWETEAMCNRETQRCDESCEGLQRIVIRCSPPHVRSLERF